MNQERIDRDYLEAIASNYVSMYCIDLRANRLIRIKSNSIIDMLAMQSGTEEAHKQLPFVMSHITEERSVKDILEFVDLVGLRDRMRGVNSLSLEFMGKVNGWCRGRFISVERDEDGDIVRVLWMVSVIDYEKRQQQKLLEMSETDKLTGLGNRRAYDKQIERLKRLSNVGNVSVAVMDVNGLKFVNDTLGHGTGDELIVGAAENVKAFFGKYGECYRTGGDEFCVIMTEPCPEPEELIKEFKAQVDAWTHPVINTLAISVGMVRGQDYEYMPIMELIDFADHRMYEDKEAYYVKSGLDRRGEQRAFTAICDSYEKILVLNLETDSYEIIKMNHHERSTVWGYEKKFSDWVRSFAGSGHVHPDDVESFEKCLSINNIREAVKQGKKRTCVQYRRKNEAGEFHSVLAEVMVSKEYSEEAPFVYIYVKEID